MDRPIRSRNDMVQFGKAAKEGWRVDPATKAAVVDQLRQIVNDGQGNARFQDRAKNTLDVCLAAGWEVS